MRQIAFFFVLGLLCADSAPAAAVSDQCVEIRKNSGTNEVLSLRERNDHYNESLVTTPAIMPKDKPLQNSLIAVVCLTTIGSALLLYNLRK